jgi:hypothetical protein
MQNLFGVIVNHDNTESLGKNARELRKKPTEHGEKHGVGNYNLQLLDGFLHQ